MGKIKTAIQEFRERRAAYTGKDLPHEPTESPASQSSFSLLPYTPLDRYQILPIGALLKPPGDSDVATKMQLSAYTTDIHENIASTHEVLEQIVFEEPLQHARFETIAGLKRKASKISDDHIESGGKLENLKQYASTKVELLEEQARSAEYSLSCLFKKKENLDESVFQNAEDTLKNGQYIIHRELVSAKASLKDNMTNVPAYQIAEKFKRVSQAYADMVSTHWTGFIDPREAGTHRSETEGRAFKQDLIAIYGQKNPQGKIWDPTSSTYLHETSIIAAHLVPVSLGYENAARLFGELGNGYAIIWDRQNGLLLPKAIEQAFDQAKIIIEPTKAENGMEYYIRVIDLELFKECDTLVNDLTWREIDGRKLNFGVSKLRPKNRYLYAMCLVNLTRRFRLSASTRNIEVAEKNKLHKITATWGRWFKGSGVEALVVSMGIDTECYVSSFGEGNDDEGAIHLTDELAQTIASTYLASEEERKEVIRRDREQQRRRVLTERTPSIRESRDS